MSDEREDSPQQPEPEAPQAIPMLVCRGEGYITRKNGEVVHFTIEGEG